MDTTKELQRWLDLLNAGDVAGREGLIGRACERLQRLARMQLKGFPLVRAFDQTDDVLNAAVFRLHRCLSEVKPESLAHFFNLAGQAIRRELLDLAKKYNRVQATVTRVPDDSPELAGTPDRGEEGPADLAQWGEFHDVVEALPEEEREVVRLLYYSGLTQAEAAEILGVAERTVLRRWHAARIKLREVLADGAFG